MYSGAFDFTVLPNGKTWMVRSKGEREGEGAELSTKEKQDLDTRLDNLLEDFFNEMF